MVLYCNGRESAAGRFFRDAGGEGIPLQLMHQPEFNGDIEELKKAATLCIKYNRSPTVHLRVESKVK